MPDEQGKLIELGRNAWRCEQARAFTPLIDGEETFAAIRSSMKKAEARIFILAWEFHSQMCMLREGEDDGYPSELGPFLNRLLDEKEELEVYVLVWDYAIIYAQEREWKIFSDWMKNPHSRIHFKADDTAPAGASHHQKVVTIDDSVAFCGGLDLSISRWDTCQHRFEDEHRTDPDGTRYSPYHDVHAVLDGDAAEALRNSASDRWRNATGHSLSELEGKGCGDAWPENVDKVFCDVEVAISRFFASPRQEVTDVEQLHLDLFASAKDHIFIENQYLSSDSLCDALAERLRESDGPKVTLILPRETSGWLVESTVGLLRDRLLEKLFEADEHDRLKVVAPEVEGDDGEIEYVYVHAKVVVVDDQILKIGSSNLSNRSMRVDSEMDLTLEFGEPNEAIERFRHRLTGMHFGMSDQEWAERERSADAHEALDKAMESGGKAGHRLADLPYGCENDLQRLLADTQLLDPDVPVDPEFLIRKSIDKQERPFVWKNVLKIGSSLVAALVLGFAIYWLWGELLQKEMAVAWLSAIEENGWSGLIVLVVFAIGGSIGVPLNFMLVTTAMVIGSRFAILYGIPGALLSSCIGFYLGAALGKPLVRRFGSEAVESVSRKLGERSFRSVAFIRLIPVAPFFIVNMVAGASYLKFKHYIVGTTLGMAPGMAAVVLLANRAEAAARRPGWGTILTLVIVVALLVGLFLFLRRALNKK